MKVRLWYCVIDQGDGSYSPAFFSTEENRDQRQQREEESNGYNLESEGFLDLEIDEDGNMSSNELDNL